MQTLSLRAAVLCLAAALGIAAGAVPAFAVERQEVEPQPEGPIHELEPFLADTRMEALDAYRIAVAGDRNDAFAAGDSGVGYYAIFTSTRPIEPPPSFWGQATVDFREGLLLVAPAGERRLFAFFVGQKGVATIDDVKGAFPGVEVIAFREGASLLYRNAPEGMTLSQLNAVARQNSELPLELTLNQTEDHGDGGGGCAQSCSMKCYDGSECSITCGLGLCASCSCEDGLLSCECDPP